MNLTTNLELVPSLRMNERIYLFLHMFSWLLQGDIYLLVLHIILKNTLFRKRDALLLCRVCSVFLVSDVTQDACGAESLLWIIIVLSIYHNGLKINESFGHLV